MKRIAIALCLLGALLVPAAAQAHTADPPHLSCAELDGSFHNFPAGPQTVVLHYTIDNIVQLPVPIGGTGPNFDTSFGYFNPDANAHVISAYFTWTADGGGQSSTTVTTITNCPKPALQADIDNLQNQLNLETQQRLYVENYLQAQIITINNRIDALSCQSDRIYRFLIRTEIAGSPVVSVDRGLVRNQAEFWSVDRVTRGGRQRFRVTADYQGLVVPQGQVRTVTSFVTTADGKHYRTVQKLRLCLPRDGNLNDTSSQGRASI